MTLKLKPYKHPLMGWYFDWKVIYLLDGGLHSGKFAIKWNNKQKLRLKPIKIQHKWADNDVEPAMYIWLKFNISFASGWGIGLIYNRDSY